MVDGKIVLVDDNEAVLRTLRLILSREFRTVVGVSNPSLLPALLREEDVDVVLLDMNFSSGKHDGCEGLFWLDRIMERSNPPEVVLITAFGEIALAIASLKRGAADFIMKPWDNDRLLATVSEAFMRRAARHALPAANASVILTSDPSDIETAPPARPITLDEMEKQFIIEVLRENGGNLSLSAQQLDISRQTLYNKMRKYGL